MKTKSPRESMKDRIPPPELLRSLPLLSSLEPADLEQLAHAVALRPMRRGQEIFDQGDPDGDIYLLVSGSVRIVRKGDDGREATLAVLGPGSVFGELSLFTGQPRTAAASAIEEGELAVLSRERFLDALLSHPRLALVIVEVLSRRLADADRTIASLLWDNAYGKVLLAVRRLGYGEGTRRGDALVVRRRVTHQEIADLAGTSRETASRILAVLKKGGAVVTSGRNLIIREALIPPSLPL